MCSVVEKGVVSLIDDTRDDSADMSDSSIVGTPSTILFWDFSCSSLLTGKSAMRISRHRDR
jgi:hypothetical protein